MYVRMYVYDKRSTGKASIREFTSFSTAERVPALLLRYAHIYTFRDANIIATLIHTLLRCCPLRILSRHYLQRRPDISQQVTYIHTYIHISIEFLTAHTYMYTCAYRGEGGCGGEGDYLAEAAALVQLRLRRRCGRDSGPPHHQPHDDPHHYYHHITNDNNNSNC